MASTLNQMKNVTNSFEVRSKAAMFGLLLALVAGSTTALAQDKPGNFGPAQSEEAAPSPAVRAQNFAPVTDPAANNKSDALEGDSEVRVDDNMTVDLHVKDEDLANVLELLSIQSQKNIIASKDVNARVTANLYGVTFYEALDAILNVNGYGFIEEGNFIKIYTLDELQKIQAANRQKVSKIVNLNYMAGVDAAEFVKPLLSPEGQIKVNSKAATFGSMSETPIGGEDYAAGSMLVIYDFEENVAQVEEMVRQIDTKPAQVLVEATILQTQLNDAVALGVDFSIVADMNFGQLASGPLGAVTGLISPPSTTNQAPADRGGTAVVGNVGNVASGNGGLKIGILSNDIGVFIRALDEVTDTTVLSNPKVMALNRQSSRVLVGRKVGYLSTTATDTSTTQTVEFLDTGTSLYFRPFVTNDNMIRMELKPKVAEAAIRQVTDIGGSAVTIPDEITNELSTNILVRDGQTVVLGGLFRESVTSTRKQVPLLGDLPIVGNAFRGKEDTTSRNEIIFLVTPTILNDAAITDAGSRGGQYIADITAGARSGVLPFSRERMTNNLNIEADKMFRDGNTEGALNKIERSLSLSPVQPELTQLREKITGSKTPSLNRSFLERVIDKAASGSLLQVKADEQLSMESGPEYDPNYVPSQSVAHDDHSQYEYMMPGATGQTQQTESNDPGVEFTTRGVQVASEGNAGLDSLAQDSSNANVNCDDTTTYSSNDASNTQNNWNADSQLDTQSTQLTSADQNSNDNNIDWNRQARQINAISAPKTFPTFTALSPSLAEQYFKQTTQHGAIWQGPTGFVRNVTTWNQFMAQWQQKQDQKSASVTNESSDGQ